MDKYTYFNYGKTGSWEIMCNFFWNKKKTVMFSHSHPMFNTLYRPAGKYYIKQWYYQQDNKLKTWYAIKDFSTYDKIINDCFPLTAEMDLPHQWHYESPFITTRGDYNMRVWGKSNIDQDVSVFYQCVDHVLDHDLINYPTPLLGYIGNIGIDDKITHDLENLQPTAVPETLRSRVIAKLKKRINIVPYKEDLEGAVKKALIGFCGNAQWQVSEDYYVEECIRKLKNNRKTYHLLCRMLEYEGIPYKVFNLDRDDYKKYFHLDRWLPIRDGIALDHDLHLHNTMSAKRQRHLPKLIDRVLCSI